MKRVINLLRLTRLYMQHNGGFRAGGIRLLKRLATSRKRDGITGIRDYYRFFINIVSHNFVNETAENVSSDVYQAWIASFDTLTPARKQWVLTQIQKFKHKPLLSILVPVYNPPEDLLRYCIESVLEQVYQNWELCIADDASTIPYVKSVLNEYAERDSRIRITFRNANGNISAASNSALELANGEFVGLLDQDDTLAPHALYFVAAAINENPDAELIYSDEDKINLDGLRSAPYFKPDWNPNLFLSHNMICHFGVYRTHTLRKIGGFREGFEGAQDYDLALRMIEQIKSNQIIHIPHVLYHWRAHPGSTALGGNEKPHAFWAGKKAIAEHLQRVGVMAEVVEAPEAALMYRVRYTLPKQLPLVSLIIPTRNALKLVRQCINSILTKTTYPNYEILLIDNGSDDPAALRYFAKLNEHPKITVIRDNSPFNYSAINNRAAQQAKGEILGLFNNDLEVISEDWLSEMVSQVIRTDVGIVGARLWYPGETLQHGGVLLVGGVAGHAHKNIPKRYPGYFGRAVLSQNFSAVTAACLLVRKTVFDEVNGLEEPLAVAFNDVDFCLRVREKGYSIVWTPYAELYHHESASRGHEDSPSKVARFKKEIAFMKTRWGKLLKRDPAYNPNLNHAHGNFSIKHTLDPDCFEYQFSRDWILSETPETKICAIVITFNSEPEKLAELLASTVKQVDLLLLVDNGSQAETLHYLQNQINEKIKLLPLQANLGIAAALNKGIAYAKTAGFSHVLLLDHDSVPAEDMVDKLYTTLKQLEEQDEKIAAVGPAYVDRKSNKSIPFTRYSGLKVVPIDLTDSHLEFVYVDFLITSGTLLSVATFYDIGEMNEELFIDNVDQDWCFKALASNRKLVGVCTAKMLHNLGDRVEKIKFPKSANIPVHAPFRLYYITRNPLLLARKPYIPTKWVLGNVITAMKRLLIFSLWIRPRKENFYSMCLGIRDGLLGKTGKMLKKAVPSDRRQPKSDREK